MEYFKPGMSGSEKDEIKIAIETAPIRYDDFEILAKSVSDGEAKEIAHFESMETLFDGFCKHFQKAIVEIVSAQQKLDSVREHMNLLAEENDVLNQKIFNLQDELSQEYFRKRGETSYTLNPGNKPRDMFFTVIKTLGLEKYAQNYFDDKAEALRLEKVKEEYNQKIAEVQQKAKKASDIMDTHQKKMFEIIDQMNKLHTNLMNSFPTQNPESN